MVGFYVYHRSDSLWSPVILIYNEASNNCCNLFCFGDLDCFLLFLLMVLFFPPGSREGYRYEEYEEDRTTVVHATMEDVALDYAVGALLGQGGFGLVKEGVSQFATRRTDHDLSICLQ